MAICPALHGFCNFRYCTDDHFIKAGIYQILGTWLVFYSFPLTVTLELQVHSVVQQEFQAQGRREAEASHPLK